MSLDTLVLMMQAAFWLLAGGLAALVLLPPLFTVLGWSQVTCKPLATIPEIWNQDFPIHPQLFDELHEQGFALLGAIQLRYWLWQNFWCLTRRYRVFGGPYTGSFALVARTDYYKGDEIAFLTLLADGGWVWTANYPSFATAKTADHSSRIYQFGPYFPRKQRFPYLFREHQQAVAKFQKTGRQIVQHDYLPVLVDSHRRWSLRWLRIDRMQHWICFAIAVVVSAVAGGLLWYNRATINQFIPESLIMLGGAWCIAVLLIWAAWSDTRSKPAVLQDPRSRVTPDVARRTPEAGGAAVSAHDAESSEAIRAPKLDDQ